MTEQIVQGDSWEFTVGIYNPVAGTNPPQPDLNSPMDLTGYDAQLQMRERPGTPAVLDLTSDPPAGLTVNGVDGTVDVAATKDQMEAIAPGMWEWAIAIDNGTKRETLPTIPLRILPRLIQ